MFGLWGLLSGQESASKKGKSKKDKESGKKKKDKESAKAAMKKQKQLELQQEQQRRLVVQAHRQAIHARQIHEARTKLVLQTQKKHLQMRTYLGFEDVLDQYVTEKPVAGKKPSKKQQALNRNNDEFMASQLMSLSAGSQFMAGWDGSDPGGQGKTKKKKKKGDKAKKKRSKKGDADEDFDGNQYQAAVPVVVEKFCLCREPSDPDRDYVGCDGQEDCSYGGWFHYECVDYMYSQADMESGLPFWCDSCKSARYFAEDDETPKMIASKVGCVLVDLVAINQAKLKGLVSNSRLKPDTALLIPGRNAVLDAKYLHKTQEPKAADKAAGGAAKKVTKKVKRKEKEPSKKSSKKDGGDAGNKSSKKDAGDESKKEKKKDAGDVGKKEKKKKDKKDKKEKGLDGAVQAGSVQVKPTTVDIGSR